MRDREVQLSEETCKDRSSLSYGARTRFQLHPLESVVICLQNDEHQWSSGRIVPCHGTDPGSIPGWCIFFCYKRNVFFFLSQNCQHLLQSTASGAAAPQWTCFSCILSHLILVPINCQTLLSLKSDRFELSLGPFCTDTKHICWYMQRA